MDSYNRLDTLWCQLASGAVFQRYVTTRDISTYVRRATAEGDEFRIKCLAGLGRDLLTSIEEGEIAIQSRFGTKIGTRLPRFLYGAWKAIFSEDGDLRPNADAHAVACIRQLTTVFSKLPGSYPIEAEHEILVSFKKNEEIMRQPISDARMDAVPLGTVFTLRNVIHDAGLLVRYMLHGLDPRDIVPRHGSGASACRVPAWERYGSFRYDPEIDRIWDYGTYFFAGSTHLCDEYRKLDEVGTLDRCARVVLVPKDYRGPRMISCEPRELMYLQQGMMRALYPHLERQGSVTAGFVNFTDQTINQELAKEGSITGALATLDLKDASDLIRWDIVKAIFPPNWVDALAVTRSGATQLPTGEVVVMEKFAPMGSSLCFPIMAITIWSILKSAMPRDTPIWVYGDDIIIPTELALSAMSILRAIDLKVNESKSFYKGPFRESCGKEYFAGVEVTPLRLKSRLTDDKPDQAMLIAFANNLRYRYGIGCSIEYMVIEMYPDTVTVNYRPCEDIDHELELLNQLGIAFLRNPKRPVRDIEKSMLLWSVFDNNQRLKRRWNSDLQRTEYRYRRPTSRLMKVDSDNWGYVLRSLILQNEEDELGATGLVAVPNRISYKYGWGIL
jgi:hypothetical protein